MLRSMFFFCTCWCTSSRDPSNRGNGTDLAVRIRLCRWSPSQFLLSDSPFIVFHGSVWLQWSRVVLLAESAFSHWRRGKPQISLKNVFVVRSETLKVDECAAPENHQHSWSGGNEEVEEGSEPELIHATFLLTEFVFVYWDIYYTEHET